MTTKITCRATECIYNEKKLCISDEITYDPDEGCLTYEIVDDIELDDEDWDEDELIDDDEDDLGWDQDDLLDDLDDDDDDDEIHFSMVNKLFVGKPIPKQRFNLD